MNAKEYLMQAWNIDQCIKYKLEQASRLREMATKVTASLSDMPRNASPNPQKMESVIARIMDTEAEVDEEIDRLVDLKIEVMRVVERVEDTNCRLVLEERYVNFMSWEDIASDLGVSVRWVHKLHAKALGEIEKILPKDTKVH